MTSYPSVAVLFVLFTLQGCSGCLGAGPVDPSALVRPVDLSAFESRGWFEPPRVEPCTLSSGTQTQCHVLSFTGRPSNHAIGPFCPATISTPGSAAGMWIDQGQVHDLSGAFVRDLGTFYRDDRWRLYDPATGAVRVTRTKAGCDAAARPNVDPAYQNYCVQCDVDAIEHPTSFTVRLPLNPVKRTRPVTASRDGKIGVSLEGVVFDPPAPIDHILAAHTIAAFDDCGGHVNPHTGYHYHAATGCSKRRLEEDGHASLIGYALDGFGLYSRLDDRQNVPMKLDTCRGHEDPKRGYHYHADAPGNNRFIGCFMGELGMVE